MIIRVLLATVFVSLCGRAGADSIKRTTLFNCGDVHLIEIQKWEWDDGVTEYGLYVRDRGTGLVLFDSSASLDGHPSGILFKAKFAPNGTTPFLTVHIKTLAKEPDGSFPAWYSWHYSPNEETSTKCTQVASTSYLGLD